MYDNAEPPVHPVPRYKSVSIFKKSARHLADRRLSRCTSDVSIVACKSQQHGSGQFVDLLIQVFPKKYE